jgi:hypothetical protein
MHGDFSRNPRTFYENVSRVLYQQGRVQLDSDANELTEAIIRASRYGLADIIGPHGGLEDSFDLFVDGEKLLLGWGVYYVDGIRCANYPKADWLDYLADPTVRQNAGKGWTLDKPPQEPALFYLDVFERHYSSSEEDKMREVALLGPDTCSRAVVTWSIRKMVPSTFDEEVNKLKALKTLPKYMDAPYVVLNRLLRSGALLRARATMSESTDPCTIAPDAQFRGTENRLYRVEIHKAGKLDGKEDERPTFKWSADNGSIVYPIDHVSDDVVYLDSLGRDDRTAIRVNDWMEVVDSSVVITPIVNDLLQVLEVRPNDTSVRLSAKPAGPVATEHAILRRWAAPATPARADRWFDLSDGVEVQFAESKSATHSHFRTGDYWLIPARTALANVIWDTDANGPIFEAPHGVDHHFAPLMLFTQGATASTSYRRSFLPISQ